MEDNTVGAWVPGCSCGAESPNPLYYVWTVTLLEPQCFRISLFSKQLNLYLNTNIAGKGYIVRLEDLGTAGQLALMFDTGDFYLEK